MIKLAQPPPEPATEEECVTLPIADYLRSPEENVVLEAEERGFKAAWELSKDCRHLDADSAFRLWNNAGRE